MEIEYISVHIPEEDLETAKDFELLTFSKIALKYVIKSKGHEYQRVIPLAVWAETPNEYFYSDNINPFVYSLNKNIKFIINDDKSLKMVNQPHEKTGDS